VGGGARCLRGARVWQGVVRFIGIIREGYIRAYIGAYIGANIERQERHRRAKAAYKRHRRYRAVIGVLV